MTDRLRLIKTVEDLHYYLIHGMMIEHATFPPYITALYSLKPGSNLEAFHVIRAVAVEEMLHLTLVANVFNAVGGDWIDILPISKERGFSKPHGFGLLIH
ncbi:ferritin-like domain-containing protein [Limnoraphis robusta]|uniref:ferritin-like domain-containing protein n=1 Tax=Limnoraphis robusta TaxID=1118279 RepID=UPI002B1FC511|nr:ferritin-like domain-containing protein [Limnoraphis robusta]MEA5498083.1 ferritin-like domain-containing protein [Limnoraphis robusta BA-68 BA1]